VIPTMELAGHFVDGISNGFGNCTSGTVFLRGDWYQRMVRKMAEVGRKRSCAGTARVRGGIWSMRRPPSRSAGRSTRTGSFWSNRERAGERRVAWALSSEGLRTGARGFESLGNSYVGWVIRTGTSAYFPARPAPRSQGVLPDHGRGKGSSRSGPAGGGQGRVSGRAGLRPPREKRFRKRHAEIGGTSPGSCSSAFHVERLESLMKKATTDGLTGLTNRKAFSNGWRWIYRASTVAIRAAS